MDSHIDEITITQGLPMPGVTKLYPHERSDFSSEELPSTYTLVDIDRGDDLRNITPAEALKIIKERGRIPLTIDEGIAIITQNREFLKRNHCFSLLASRIPGNKRVPAIWINAKNEPNLGWCWEGNPHTWLGSASAKSRIF